MSLPYLRLAPDRYRTPFAELPQGIRLPDESGWGDKYNFMASSNGVGLSLL